MTSGGITAHVIAGEALGARSPIYTKTPVHYIHFYLEPHTTLHQPISKGWNAFIYSLDGAISVGTPNKSKLISAHHTITLTNKDGQDGVTVTTFDQVRQNYSSKSTEQQERRQVGKRRPEANQPSL